MSSSFCTVVDWSGGPSRFGWWSERGNRGRDLKETYCLFCCNSLAFMSNKSYKRMWHRRHLFPHKFDPIATKKFPLSWRKCFLGARTRRRKHHVVVGSLYLREVIVPAHWRVVWLGLPHLNGSPNGIASFREGWFDATLILRECRAWGPSLILPPPGQCLSC